MRLLAALLVTTVAVTGCSGSAADDDGRLHVVASFYPLAEAAERVGGDLVTVENLTPPGVEPHDLELAPDDLEALVTADLVLYVGGGFQPAVEDGLAEADGRVVDALDAVSVLSPTGDAEETVDPHFWLDPGRYADFVATLADVLGDMDGGDAAAYDANAEPYEAELASLDGVFADGLAECARTQLVVSHEAFGYLADAYGLEQVPIAGLSPEAEPDPARLDELRALVEETGTTTIFTEELASPDVAEALAREAGVETAVLNPLEGLTDEEVAAGEDYVSVMRENLDTLRSALDCS